MFCGQCGTQNADTSRFCQQCGSPLPLAATVGVPGFAPPVAVAARGAIPDLPTSEFGGFWMRFFARWVDSFITVVLAFAIGAIVGLMSGGSAENRFTAGWSAGMLVSLVYEVAAPVLWGAHVGKLVFGYRIVTADGRRLNAGTSFLRYLCTYLSSIALFIGYLVAAFDAHKQTWHDKIAGTYVVRAKHEVR
jgi:uncharacterized RDD family membrane protein YckC